MPRGVTPPLAGDHSFVPGESRRIASASSEKSDVFENPDGSHTRKLYEAPVNYRASDGTWKPIDTNLVTGADERLRPQANSALMELAATADDPALATLAIDESHSVSYSLQGAAQVTPTVSGSTATYSEVLPGTDLTLRTTATSVKETLVLHSVDVATSWVFPLRLQGLTPHLQEDGTVLLRDENGETRSAIAPSWMRDSRFDAESGGFVTSHAITHELITVDEGPALRISIDEGWLNAPERVFPVIVDPTLGLDTDADTYTRSDDYGNHSTEDELLVGTYNGGTSKAHSFLRFMNFTSTFGGQKLTSVALKLFLSYAYTCTPKPFSVHAILGAWGPNGVPEYPGPAFDSTALGTASPDPGAACTNTAGDRSVGVWATVALDRDRMQAWTLSNNFGLAVTASQSDSTQWKRFTSREGPDPVFTPYLQITYTDNVAPQVDGQYPPSGYAATSLTPELAIAARDPDNWPHSLTYQFQVFDKNATKIAESPWIRERNWRVPAGTLKWGESYAWTVFAKDGYLPSTSQRIHILTTPVPQRHVASGLSQNDEKGFEPSIGNYTTSAVDATVATVGPPLTVKRSYNSQDARTGLAFGEGWSSVLDMKAIVPMNGTISLPLLVVTYPNGQEVTFGRNSDGTYTAPSGRFATLTTISSGGYRLVDKDGTTYEFAHQDGSSSSWHISAITDPAGRRLTFVYGHPTLSSAVTQIVSASGRELHLTWSTPSGAGAPQPHVESVATDEAVAGDPTTQTTWSYTYNGDQLTEVCPPTSSTACTTYGYTSGSGYQNAVMNAGPRSYWRLGENSGTVAASANAGQVGGDSGTYVDVSLGQPGPLTGSAATAAGFNGTSSYVALPSPIMHNYTHQSVSLWFKTTTTGRVLLGRSADPLTEGSTSGAYAPVLYIGGDGKLVGQFPTEPAGLQGTLVSWGSGKCLDVPGSGNANSTPVHLWSCHGSPNQQWTLTSSGELQVTINGVTKCLDAKGAGVVPRTEIQIYECIGVTNEKWTVSADGQIINVNAKMCLDVLDNGTADGTNIVLAPCRTPVTVNQAWFGSAHAPMQSSGSVADGNWHHAVLSGAGGVQNLYVDGVLVGTKSGRIRDIGQKYFTLGAGYLGGGWPNQPAETTVRNTGTVQYFNGSIGETAFYDRGLTTEEVDSIWAAGRTASRPLTAITRPSGNRTVEVSYDPATGAVSEVTDQHGGLWKIGTGVVSGSPEVHASTVLGAGPVDYWRLADSGTTESVNEVNGGSASYSSVTLGVPGGPFDDPERTDDDTTVASFNGTSAYIQLPAADIPTTGPQSISMWFKMPAGHTAGATLYSYQYKPLMDSAATTASWVPALYVGVDGKLRGQYWTGAANPITTSGTVNDGKWHHVVLAASTNSQTLYLDGEAVGTRAGNLVATNAAYTYLGAGEVNSWPSRPANHRGFFTGEMAEVAIYRTQLSADQVSAQFFAREKSSGSPIKTIVVTDPGDESITYVYDAVTNRLVAETDATGGTTSYGYDQKGFLRTVGDPNGNLTITEHDVRGNTVSSRTCQNQRASLCSTIYYTYHPDATSTNLTPDPRNDVLLTVRDGRSSGPTDNNYLTSYTYDTNGNRTKVTDPLNRETVTAYTDGTTVPAADGGFAPAGLPRTVTTPGNAVQEVTYYRSGDVATVTDPAGKVTGFTYDGLGRVVTRTETTDSYPAGLVTSYEYDELGRVIVQTDPAVTNRVTGAVHTPVTTTVYDDEGLVLSRTTTDATGGDAPRTESATYNQYGQQVTSTDPTDQTTTFEYDAYGRVRKETDPAGKQIASAYDASGNLLTTTLLGWTGDPNNPSAPTDLVLTSKAYDPAGRLAVETDAMGWETHYTYTDNGLTATVTRKDPSTGTTFVQEANTYDAAGHLVSQQTDNLTTTTTQVVDRAGRVTSSALDPSGLNRTTTYTYSPDDHVLSTVVADGSGTVAKTEATYDPLGRVTSRTIHKGTSLPADLLVTTYTLDQRGLPLSMTDAENRTTEFDHDEAGQLAVTVSPEVTTEVAGGAPVLTRRVTYVGYNTFGEQVESKDPNGNVTVTEYDAEGRVTATRLPSYTPPGATEAFDPVISQTYDGVGQLITRTDPLGGETSYVYDQLGRVAKATTPDDGATEYAYDLLGDQLSTVDPTGARTEATYDFLGRVLTSTDVVRQTGASHTTTYEYGTDGRLARTLSPAGVEIVSTYNAAGETLTARDGAGNVTGYAYDGAGRNVRITLPDGTYSTTVYDLAGRAVESRSYHAGGTLLRTRSSEYDKVGNVVETTDGRGTSTTFTYDSLGQLVSEVQPISTSDAITTTFGYDLAGNRTRFTDGRGNRFITTYNTWNLPESQIEPATSAWPNAADRTFTVGYDLAGRVKTQSVPGGVTVTNTYDEMGRLTQQSGTGAEVTTADRVFDYDLAGRLVSAAGSAGTNAFGYDDRGLLTSASGVSGASSFTYTPDREIATRTDAAGTTAYGYDPAGRLATVSNPTAQVATTLTYDPVSNVKTIGYGSGGNTRSFTYDGLQRITEDKLTTSSAAVVAKINYGWNENDDLISKTTSGFAGATSNTYTYDLADRLISWDDGTTPTLYAYDKSGNRLQVGTRTFSYDQRNQLTSDSGGTTYQYSARGTLLTASSLGASVSTETDAFGQIAAQQVTGGATTTYTYDGLGRAIRPGFSYTGTSNILAADSAAAYTRGPDGGLLGVSSGGTKVLAWTDGHTDVVGQFTATGGTLSGSTAYDPLGRVLATTGMLGQLGYQSGWTDTTTGRVNMAARWYNPDTGQFDTRDAATVSPVPDSISANRFQYGDANPLTSIDASGQFSLKGAFRSVTGGVSKAWNSAKSYASRAWNAASSYVSSAYNAAKDFVVERWHAATNWVKDRFNDAKKTVNNARNWVADKVEKSRQYVAQKIAEQKRRAQELARNIKQAGKNMVAKANKNIAKAANAVQDAYKATVQWVKEHKAEIAGFLVGAVVGLGCGALVGWTGVGAVACGALAGAVGSAVTGAMRGQRGWELARTVGLGAVSGMVGGAAGVVGSRVVGAAMSQLGGFAGSLGGRVVGGGLAGGLGDAIAQVATTGRVDVSGVAVATVLGAVTGAKSCRGHSFAPATRVLMADGGSRRIDEVNIGDRVLAADPESGRTAAKPVTALHLNRDTELADVRVSVTRSGGRGVEAAGRPAEKNEAAADESRSSVTLRTTANHPFWDSRAGRWVLAGMLVAGTVLATPAAAAAIEEPTSPSVSAQAAPSVSVSVETVRNHTGVEDMRDLTVADLHTYYVLAGDQPVLVHNCGGGIHQDKYSHGGSVRYGGLDAHHRPTSVSASITSSMLNTGSAASSRIRPPGWRAGRGDDENVARGHLLARMLGGSGSRRSNLVTITQDPVNSPIMRDLEQQIFDAVRGGQTVQYTATAVYHGGSPIPMGIRMQAYGNGGFKLNEYISNPAGMFGFDD